METPNFRRHMQEQDQQMALPPEQFANGAQHQQMPMSQEQFANGNQQPMAMQQQMMDQNQMLSHPQSNVPMAQPDPFAADQYQNVNVPDVPVNFGGTIADGLLNDNEVPEEVKKKFWFIFHKDNTLTFLDEESYKRKLLNFDIMKIDILNSIPYYGYTFERELEFDVLRNVFETKLDRAKGTRGQNVKNERIMLQSQFQEQRQISEDGNSQIKEGFFKHLLGRR